jgi:hypothetical protein
MHKGSALSLDRFCALDHALVSFTGERFWGVADDALAKINRERQRCLDDDQFSRAGRVTAYHRPAGRSATKTGGERPGLVAFETPVEIPGFTKLAVWHERTHRDPGHRWVRALLFESVITTV